MKSSQLLCISPASTDAAGYTAAAIGRSFGLSRASNYQPADPIGQDLARALELYDRWLPGTMRRIATSPGRASRKRHPPPPW